MCCLPPQKCVANLHDNSKSNMVAIVNKVYCSRNRVISICNCMGPRAINDYFRAYFSKFSQNCPTESRSDDGNLENFENTSEINP